MRHPGTDSLIGFMEGSLADSQHKLVKAHIEGCPHCFIEMMEWSGLDESLRFPALENPPEDATRNCLATFQPREKESTVYQVIAVIVFDSAFATEASGVRGSSEARQIRLRGGDADVHLRISGSNRRVFGQIFQISNGNFVAGAHINVLRAGEVISTVVTDAMGEFGFNLPQDGALNFEADLPSGQRLVGSISIDRRNQ